MLDDVILPNKLLPVFKPRLHRLIKAVRPYAMVSRNRLQNLHRLATRVDRERVEGDVIEAGVARGGSAVLLAAMAGASPLDRQVWLYDAFELFDHPEVAPYDVVHQTLFETFGFDEQRVHLIKGWFEQTVPRFPDRRVALLHVDTGDYDSVKLCLSTWLGKVSEGGWVAFDNYGHSAGEPVRRAVHECMAAAGIPAGQLRRFGSRQAYFQKVTVEAPVSD